MTSHTDKKLLRYNNIIDDNQGIIVKLCRGYTNNIQDLEDTIQEVYLQIWKALDSFKGKSKYSTWIYRITLNVCLNSLSKKSKRKESTTDALKIEQLANDRVEMFRSESPVNILYQSIQTLEPLDRGIIMLYLDKRKQNEIAEIMGTTTSNIGVKINRIKKRLKSIVDERHTSTLG